MTVLALGAEFFPVRVFLLVAFDTFDAGLMIFLAAEMTGLAAGGNMHALECEIRLGVIECLGVKMNNVSIPAEMVAMAAFAIDGLVRVKDAAVIATLFPDVIRNIFMIMAINAALALCVLAE